MGDDSQGNSDTRSKAILMLRLTRMHFLLPGFLLYILGFLLANLNGGEMALDRFLLGFAIFYPAQLAVSFSNDYFDVQADKRSNRTPLSGGSGVLVENPEFQPLAIRIAVALMLISAVMAVVFFLLFRPAWYFLPLAWGGNLLGWFYTAPPLRLAYRGLGEVTTAIAAGFIMPGLGYLCSLGHLDLWFLGFASLLMCYGFFFILTVEMPDIDADRLGGKNNLLVRKGLEAGARWSLIFTILGSLGFLFAAVSNYFDAEVELWALFLLSLFPLLVAALGFDAVRRGKLRVERQAKMNFASMMTFMFLAILMLMVYLNIV
jgi:1,4-dihydroxy-2-naphthoate octaprenyltransferase